MVIILVMVFLGLEGFFSGSETAIISASKAKLRLAASRQNHRAKLALELLGKSEELLATTLVGTNVSVVTGTTLATWLIARWVPKHWDESLLATLIMTPIILVCSELLPKCVFRTRADSMALHIARPLRLSQRLLYVLISLSSRITRLLLWLTGGRRSSISVEAARKELQALAQIGEEHGVLGSQTRRMIQSVFDLGERPVGVLMVRLNKAATLPLEATVDRLERLAGQTGYSHFPVYQGRRDNIVGIVNLTDIMYGPASAEEPIEHFVRREVTRVPPGQSVGALLTGFRYSQIPLAIVVDDDGRALGLVSPQDLLEEVVGTIRDERLDEAGQSA